MNETCCVRRFEVEGELSAQLPLRILNMFAQQDIAVREFRATQSGSRYEVEIVVDNLAQVRSAIILEKLRSLILVARADCT